MKSLRKVTVSARMVGALLGCIFVGILTAHFWFDVTATNAFRLEAEGKGLSSTQIDQWLRTGWLPHSSKGVGSAVYMGNPINYGSYPHLIWLIYGAISGLACGTVVVVIIAIAKGRRDSRR